jgi:hypothetical protein
MERGEGCNDEKKNVYLSEAWLEDEMPCEL